MECWSSRDEHAGAPGAQAPDHPGEALVEVAAATSESSEETKVRTIQSRWRAHNLRAEIESVIAHEFAAPSMSVSRAAQRALLPKLESDDLVPLHCSLDTFSCFGSGVYCYMLWIRLMSKAFFAAFLVNLPTMFHNANGAKLHSANWMTIT